MSDAHDHAKTVPARGAGFDRPVADSVGAELRASREARGETIDDVSAILKIRDNHISAIEEGRFGDLPGQTYAIGFVRTYASYLGFDPDDVVRRFKAEVVGLEDKAELVVFGGSEREGRIPLTVLAVGSVALAAAIYALWYFFIREPEPEALSSENTPGTAVVAEQDAETAPVQSAQPETPATEPDEPAASAVSEPDDAATPDATPPATTPEEAPAQPSEAMSDTDEPGAPAEQMPAAEQPSGSTDSTGAAATADDAATPGDAEAETAAARAEPAASYDIVLEVIDDSWVEIRADDGEVVLSRVLRPGETYDVPDRPGLTMIAGNAGAVRLRVNGEVVPPLGPIGVVRRDIELSPEALLSRTAE